MTESRLHSVTMQKLRIFAAVARERSFAKAADTTLLSAPTISDQIKKLETLIGMRLLDRSRGRRVVELTEAGEILLQGCGEIFQSIEKADTALEGIKRLKRGTATLGASLAFCNYFLPVIREIFYQAHPSINLCVYVDTHQHILERLARRQTDIAVLLATTEHVGFICEPLAPYHAVLVGLPGHRLAGISPAPFKELAQERLILSDRSSQLRKAFESMAAQAGISLNVVMEVSNSDTRRDAVLHGIGITLLGTHSLAAQGMAGELCVLRVEGFPIRMDWFIVHPPTKLSPSAQALKDHLLQSRNMLLDVLPVSVIIPKLPRLHSNPDFVGPST